MFGSIVITIPFMVITAYTATRYLKKENADQERKNKGQQGKILQYELLL